MATKKSASKKAAGSETGTETPAVKTAAKKTAEKKTAAKKTPAKTAEPQAASSEPKGHQASKGAKAKPTHHDVQLRAYLLAEKDHGRHSQDYYWHKAEQELAAE
jgi:hypothetical protein